MTVKQKSYAAVPVQKILFGCFALSVTNEILMIIFDNIVAFRNVAR
jgi:hypothetical protein